MPIQLFPYNWYGQFTYDSFITLGSFSPLATNPGVVAINGASNYVFNSNEIKDIGWYQTGIDIQQQSDINYPVATIHVRSDSQDTYKYRYSTDETIEGTIENGKMIIAESYAYYYDTIPSLIAYNTIVESNRPYNAGDFNLDLIVDYLIHHG